MEARSLQSQSLKTPACVNERDKTNTGGIGKPTRRAQAGAVKDGDIFLNAARSKVADESETKRLVLVNQKVILVAIILRERYCTV